MDLLCVEFVIFLIGLHPYEDMHMHAHGILKPPAGICYRQKYYNNTCRSMPFFGNGAEYLQCYYYLVNVSRWLFAIIVKWLMKKYI